MDVRDNIADERRSLCHCEQKSYLHKPIKYSSVSTHWRDVTRATPRLWTSFHMGLYKLIDNDLREDKITLLRCYFERASVLPLSLCFVPATRSKLDELNNADEANMKAIFDVARHEYSTRLGALHLTNTPLSWITKLGDRNNVYPQLHSLEITTYQPTNNSVFVIPLMPNLQFLGLNGTSGVQLSTATLTCLRLSKVQLHVGIRLLLECRETLVEFQYRRPPLVQDEVQPDDRVTLIPNLETFGWELYMHGRLLPWERYMLYNLNIPSLRNVSLVKLDSAHIPTTRPNLFTRISSTLTNVEIYSVMFAFLEDGPQAMFQMFQMFDTRRLVLEFDESPIHALVALAGKCLPSLRVLSLTDQSLLNPVMSEDSDQVIPTGALISMVEERAGHYPNLKDEPFILDLVPTLIADRLSSDEDIGRSLRMLLVAGIRLRLVMNHTTVDERMMSCHALYHKLGGGERL